MRLPDNHNHADGSKNGNGVFPSGAKCKKRKRIVSPASGNCQECKISESSAWHKGPDGIRNRCHSCGMKYAKYMKRQALTEQNNAEIERLPDNQNHAEGSKNGDGVLPSGGKQQKRYGNVASSSTSPHESSLTLPRLEGLPNLSFISQSPQYPPYQNHAEGSRNGNGVEGSMERWTTMYQPATAEANPIDATCLLPAVPLSPCAPIFQFHTPQRLPASSDPMIAASSFQSIPALPTKALSMTAHAISKRNSRARDRLAADATSFPGILTLQTSKALSTHPKAVRARKCRALETPEMHTARLAKVKAYDTRIAEQRARVQATPPTQPNKRRKLTKEK